MCIDNDSNKCLGILLKHFASDIEAKVLDKQHDWLTLVRRCLLMNSGKCLKKIMKTKIDIEKFLTPIEIELAVYFASPEIVQDVIKCYYKNIALNDRKLSERVIKACIYGKNMEYLTHLIDITKNCAIEYDEIISTVEIKDWFKDEINNAIYNFDYMKKRKEYRKVDFVALYKQYNDNNMLQYAIEQEDEKIAAIIMKSNVNFWTKRKSDQATCLILATKVIL